MAGSRKTTSGRYELPVQTPSWPARPSSGKKITPPLSSACEPKSPRQNRGMCNAAIDTAQSALRAALFDLDGTLLDTVADLAMAANALREHYQLPLLSEDQIAEFVGKGMENLVRRTLAGSRHIPAHLA